LSAAYGKATDGQWIEERGQVRRLLNDAPHDERHQRFVVRIAGGQTLLVAHNLEIAERVPLGLGDRIRFRGLYAFNHEGGVVHFTHRDPHGQEAGGWVEYRKTRYA